jgi:hypothetical protein
LALVRFQQNFWKAKKVRLLDMPMTNRFNLLGYLFLLFSPTWIVSTAGQTTPTLKQSAPADWVQEKTTSTMRVAQFKTPKVNGDEEDAYLVLYYFGEGQGGDTTANIERWVGQMRQPDGKLSVEKAKSETLKINGLQVTTVDVSGTYVAETAPGSGTFHNKPNFRLRAAIVETPRGSYYVKYVGPEKTMAHWEESYLKYLKSFRFE